MVPGCNIPIKSTGEQPANTSRNELHLLNTATISVIAKLTIYHTDKAPVGPYEIQIAPKRIRNIRMNDLIDPQAIPLGTDFAILIEANRKIVVQYTYVDTSETMRSHASILGMPL